MLLRVYIDQRELYIRIEIVRELSMLLIVETMESIDDFELMLLFDRYRLLWYKNDTHVHKPKLK